MRSEVSETKPCKLYLPVEVFVPLEHLTMDPMTEKPRYGARSALVTKLLIRYFEEINFSFKSEPLDDNAINSIGNDQ